MPVTSQPASNKHGTRTEPTYPLCPVTKTRPVTVPPCILSRIVHHLASHIEQRHLRRHQHRRTTGYVSRLCIALVVTYERSAGQVQAQLSLRLKEETRLRFAALTAGIPIVRTTVHGLDVTARLLNFRPHPLMNLLEIGLRHDPAPNACLVRDDDHPVARFLEEA